MQSQCSVAYNQCYLIILLFAISANQHDVAYNQCNLNVIFQTSKFILHLLLPTASASVAEPGAGAAGAATFRVAPEPEPIFLLVGARSQSRTF